MDKYMIYVRRRVCSSQQQKNGPSTSMISYKTDNSEEQDGFLSISRRGYNGRNNIQYVSERIPNNALHHITPFPLHRSSKHRPCNEHIYQAYMDIPSRGWEERSWIVIGGPWCWTIALFCPTEKKVRLEIKQRGQQADNCDVAREESVLKSTICLYATCLDKEFGGDNTTVADCTLPEPMWVAVASCHIKSVANTSNHDVPPPPGLPPLCHPTSYFSPHSPLYHHCFPPFYAAGKGILPKPQTTPPEK